MSATNDDPVHQALDALSSYLIGSDPLDATVRRVAEITVSAFPAARFAGISTLIEGEPCTAVFTDEMAPEIDAAQYESGEGPCLDSYRHRRIYRINDTESEKRWPSFTSAASGRGIRSTISFPMVANDEPVGALNLYSPEVAGFADVDDGLGVKLATQAAVLLTNSQVYWDAYRLTETLQEAMRSRATIEQAKGMIMARSRCTSEDAFAILVRASQRENRKLRDIAAEIVERSRRRPSDARDAEDPEV
jgi:GAF domain-containing protein